MTEEHPGLESCETCRKPRRQASGSLTQWVFDEKYCDCGRTALSPPAISADPDVAFCFKCGKRKSGGRAGSLTQWIFRQEECSCAQEVLLRIKDSRDFAEEDFSDEAIFDDSEDDGPLVANRLKRSVLYSAVVAAFLFGVGVILLFLKLQEPFAEDRSVDLRSMDSTSETLKSVKKFHSTAEDIIDSRFTKDVNNVFHITGGMVALHGKYANDKVIARLKLPAVYAATIFLKDGDVTDTGLNEFYPQLELQDVNLNNLPNITEDGILGLCRQNKIRRMILSQVAFGKQLISRLARCPHLQLLDTRYNEIEGVDLSVLSHLKNLRALGLRQTRITEQQLDQVMQLPYLVTLDITGGDVSDVSLLRLVGHPSLRAIFVAGNNSTTTSGLAKFSKLSHCRVFDSLPYPVQFENYERFLRDADIKRIPAGAPLNLCNWSITDSGIKSVAGRSSEVLKVSGTALTDACFPALAKVKGVRTLGLASMNKTSDHGLKLLHGLNSVERLDVSGGSYSDEAIAALCAHMPRLTTLCASHSRIGARTMKSLFVNCRAIEIIRADHCHLSDHDLSLAARLPGLHQLIVNANPDVTSKGIAMLERSPNLHELQLSAMPEARMKEIKNRFINHCVVIFNYNDGD